jgi:pimeloyl-ACP methyl ester carboxylesterase
MPCIRPEEFFPSLDIETVTIGGVKALRGAGPTLLLHGGTGSWTHWVRNIEPLARQFSVVVPDLPGMGESLDGSGIRGPGRLRQLPRSRRAWRASAIGRLLPGAASLPGR